MPTRSALPPDIVRSRHNAQLKDLRRRLRSDRMEGGLVAIEGDHLLREAMESGLRFDTVIVREDRAAEMDTVRLSGNPRIIIAAADAFDSASATGSPQGMAALVEAPQWRLEDALRAENASLMILAGLQDPGNIGTIIRTAEAFGAAGILLTPGSVHPWNQKVLRASAGSSFRLPAISLESEKEISSVANENLPIYATSAKDGIALHDAKLHGRAAFVIGNEGAGIPKSVLRYCSDMVHIPCPGPVESLNAAVAASILLYETARQRRAAAKGKSQ